ncbi:hypothetical protein PIB30_019130 [Stylosanthes scabra]|uniref:Uncharacterized protein n=1 Tax=Stylosanthes scabra TaxID=79078 RepID=A0ABU6WA37_9FABA|nr:hypothetical protein [Stylosanthes scabra]
MELCVKLVSLGGEGTGSSRSAEVTITIFLPHMCLAMPPEHVEDGSKLDEEYVVETDENSTLFKFDGFVAKTPLGRDSIYNDQEVSAPEASKAIVGPSAMPSKVVDVNAKMYYKAKGWKQARLLPKQVRPELYVLSLYLAYYLLKALYFTWLDPFERPGLKPVKK